MITPPPIPRLPDTRPILTEMAAYLAILEELHSMSFERPAFSLIECSFFKTRAAKLTAMRQIARKTSLEIQSRGEHFLITEDVPSPRRRVSITRMLNTERIKACFLS